VAEEARRIFELAEPLDLLSGHPVEEVGLVEDRDELLLSWAGTAPRFRPLNEVIEQIRRLRLGESRRWQMDADTATRYMQDQMLFETGLTLLDSNRIDQLEYVLDEFASDETSDKPHWAWFHVHSWRHLIHRDPDMARQLVENVLAHVDELPLDDELSTHIAEATYRVLGDGDRARQLIQGVGQPASGMDVPPTDAGMDPFWQRLRLNRLLTALGEGVPPNQAVPEPARPEERGLVIFERAICNLARIWGHHWRGNDLDVHAFAYEAGQLLDVFHQRSNKSQHWYLWYAVQGACSEFCCALVAQAEELGPPFVAALRDEFEQRWMAPRTAEFWPADARRSIAVDFGRLIAHRAWASDQLVSIGQCSLQDEDAIQRIEQHKKQARAWLDLQQPANARTELQIMLEHSFGVLSHKDYQLSGWVNWLPAVNATDPAGAADRVGWFAGAALAMSDFADSRATAEVGRELLETVFSWQPSSALVLFDRFMDAGTLHYDRAVLALLRAALDTEQPPIDVVIHVLADFLFPIATESDTELARRLVATASAHLPPDGVAERVRYVAERSRVYALPSASSVWRQGLARGCDEAGVDLAAAGLVTDDLRPTSDDYNSPRIIRLENDQVLSLAEVLRRCTDPTELRTLYEAEHDDSHLDWPAVVSQLAPHLDRTQVDEVAAIFQGDREEALVLAPLSERLLQLGYGEDARSLAQHAFDASSPRGWDQYWDGGTRLRAAQAMLAIAPAGIRRAVIDSLMDDLLSEFWWPKNLAMNLSDIVALMTENVPVLELWDEIEEHLAALFRDVELPDVDIPGDAPGLPEDMPGLALAHLIAAHVDHPCSAVLEAAQRACGQLLLKRNTYMQEAVRRLLAGTESQQQHMLVILDAVSLEGSGGVSVFRREIEALAGSANYAIRAAARAICTRSGWSVSTNMYGAAGLPPIYSIALPPADVPRDSQRLLPQPGEPMPDSTDPLVIVQPFDADISAVADITGLPWANICHRVVAIMRELSPQEEWSANAERRLRGHLEAVSLRFPFRRPRAVLARRAVFRAVGEIVAAAPPPEHAVASLEHILRCHDPTMVFVEPCAKPDEIAPLVGGDEYGHFREDWPLEVGASLALAARQMGDGQTILAEHTELRSLGRPGPRETRRSCIHPCSMVLSSPERDYDTTCRTVLKRLVTEYHALDREWDPVPLIIHNRDYGFLTPGPQWLALNPMVARELGWRPSDEALLAWTDDDGVLMVHTVWWRQGQPNAWGYSHDEVGEGWLVLASPEAISTVEATLGELRRAIVVERSLGEGDEPLRVASRAEDA